MKIGLVVLKREQLKSGNYRIKVSLYHNSETCYLSTPYEISSLSHFKDGMIVKEPGCEITNLKLRNLLNKYQDILNEIRGIKGYSCKQLKELILKEDEKDNCAFESVADEYTGLLRNERRESYALLIDNAKRYFLEFTNGDIPIKNITPYIIESFSRYLFKRRKQNGHGLLSDTMVSMILSRVKVIINYSIKTQKASFPIHPFINTKIQSSTIRELDISIEDLAKIMNYSPDTRQKEISKDVFLLSFYSCGMNLIDLLKTDFRKDKIDFCRTKTMHRNKYTYSIPIQSEAKTIAEKWITANGTLKFNNMSYHNLSCFISKGIAKIKSDLRIEGLFLFYSARKTYSQLASDFGVPQEIIDYSMAHSDYSRGVIRFYTKVKKEKALKTINEFYKELREQT